MILLAVAASDRACRDGRQHRTAPHRLCRLSRGRSASCKIYPPRAQPYVHRAKLNTTASGKIYPGKCQQRAFYSQMEGATTSLIDGSVFAR